MILGSLAGGNCFIMGTQGWENLGGGGGFFFLQAGRGTDPG